MSLLIFSITDLRCFYPPHASPRVAVLGFAAAWLLQAVLLNNDKSVSLSAQRDAEPTTFFFALPHAGNWHPNPTREF